VPFLDNGPSPVDACLPKTVMASPRFTALMNVTEPPMVCAERSTNSPSVAGLRNRGKDVAMKALNTRRSMPDRMGSALVAVRPGPSGPRSASIHMLEPSTRPGQHRGLVQNTQTPSGLRNQMAEFLVDVEGLPVAVRILVKELLAEMQSSFVSTGADIHTLLSSTLARMADRIGGSPLRGNDLSEQSSVRGEGVSSGERLDTLSAPLNETVLRVGPLELDLIERSAKRRDRQIDLRPREFHLLKYMMQRSGKLLTRAILFREVWNYKFVPESNLVDVHMGRLRRKVDAADEAPMIRNVRGVGFVLTAISFQNGSTRAVPEALPN
jgi:DNA-binding winged helix-turn-helix (wHTH) protein